MRHYALKILRFHSVSVVSLSSVSVVVLDWFLAHFCWSLCPVRSIVIAMSHAHVEWLSSTSIYFTLISSFLLSSCTSAWGGGSPGQKTPPQLQREHSLQRTTCGFCIRYSTTTYQWGYERPFALIITVWPLANDVQYFSKYVHFT